MSAQAKKKARALVEQFMKAGEEADRRVYAAKQAEAKARLEEEDRSGAHDRIRWLDELQRRLERFCPVDDPGVRRLLELARVRIHAMFNSMRESQHHEWEPRDKDRLETLALRLDDAKRIYEAAIELQRHRAEIKKHGQRGGKKGGFKGGRPSAKPLYVDLRREYEKLLADHDKAAARKRLIEQLQKNTGAKPRTIREWLLKARIT